MNLSRRGFVGFLAGLTGSAFASGKLAAPAAAAVPAVPTPASLAPVTWPTDGPHAKIGDALRARLGDDIYRSWFHTLEIDSFDGRTVTVSVPVKFLRTWIENHYADDLPETGFPPHRLEIEITEQALVSDFAAAKHVINSLRNIGIKIALDDFGTGYSSLYYLAELPFDTIKIDRSLIATLHERDESRKIVTAIVGLGKSLGLSTIAEGVESGRTVDLLREIGCRAAQGYYFGKPMPIAEAAAFIGREPTVIDRRAIA